MKNVVSAEWFKESHDKLMWFVPLYYIFFGFYSTAYSSEVFDLYYGLEFFSFSNAIRIYFPLAIAVVTGYAIGGDFSKHTIQNALTIGVNKRDYYFARLATQMLLTGSVFLVAVFVHTIMRLIDPKGNAEAEIDMLALKFTVYVIIMLLQILAYVSVINALVYFIKKQFEVMAIGMGLIYLEVIIRQVVKAKEEGVLLKIVDHFPTGMLMNMLEYAVYDEVLTAEFFQMGIYALVIIIISSAIGYLKFYYDAEIK